MNYEFLRTVIGTPWQVEVQTLNSLLPILRGMITGLNVDRGQEPQNHQSYRIGAKPSQGFAPAVNQDSASQKVIHVLPLRSVLTKHDQDCGPKGTRTLATRLLEADSDPSVVGHIFTVESGGGQSIAVPEMTEAMEKCTKPIVAWVDGMSASAAYYICAFASEIIASREMDVIGCIGTMLVWSGRKSKSAENEEGELEVTIYADGSEEKNLEYEQAINDFNFTLAKERLLNPLNAKFKADVLSQRPSVTPEHLSGRTYFASEVVGTLIDSIGNMEFAIERLLSLANFSEDTQDQSNQSLIIQPMAKQFAHLNHVLNVEVLEGTDEGMFLNEEQLESINQALEANQQLVTERDNAVQTANEAAAQVETMTQTVTEAQAASAAAFDPINEIDPSIASATTPEEKATAMRALLSAKPAALPIQTIGQVEEESTQDADWDTINSLPHNKILDSQS